MPVPIGDYLVHPSKALIATYADDIAILYNSPSRVEAANEIQGYLDSLAAWCRRWNLKVNPTKTVNPCFTLERLAPTTPAICFEGVTLEQPAQAKYLGVVLDKRL
ncbi:hypothetical protein KR093_010035, partial [Drosophila rubida]